MLSKAELVFCTNSIPYDCHVSYYYCLKSTLWKCAIVGWWCIDATHFSVRHSVVSTGVDFAIAFLGSFQCPFSNTIQLRAGGEHKKYDEDCCFPEYARRLVFHSEFSLWASICAGLIDIRWLICSAVIFCSKYSPVTIFASQCQLFTLTQGCWHNNHSLGNVAPVFLLFGTWRRG